MKKRFFCFIKTLAIVLVCIFSLSACTCGGEQAIPFKENFLKGYNSNIPNDYFEELTYKVAYKSDMYGYTVSSKLNPNDFVFGEGTYKTELKRLDEMPQETLKNNEVLKTLSGTDKIYSYKTTFSIPVTYFDGNTYTDTIETIVYFCPQNMSFAPIYSSTNATYTVFTCSGEQKSVDVVSYLSSVTYNKETYVKTLKNVDGTSQTVTNKYDFKCLIDNAQLLFALRNFEVLEGNPKGISVVNTNYNEKTLLGVYFNETLAEKFNGTFNGNPLSEDVKLDKISFRVNDTKNAGKEHFLYIQNNESVGSLPNNAYLYKYVQPLIAYGSFEVMGSLEFTLISIKQA